MRLRETEQRDLRELLGLRDDATPAEVMEAYRELERFLAPDRVPPRLRKWAERQLAEMRPAAPAAQEPAKRPAPRSDLPDFFEEDEAIAPPPTRRKPAASREATPRRNPAGRPRRRSPLAAWRGVALVLGIALAVVGLVVGNPSLMPGQAPSGGAAPSAPPPAAPQLNEARVAELKAVVERDPRNADALFELGEMHFQANRWQDSIDWFRKLLEVDPGNVHALTDIGTASYNLGREDEARQVWEDVAARAPDDPQIHYNLGFLYANSDSQDLDRALKEWETVVRLAPNTDLARTAQAHLDALKKK